ncbi:fatty acid desaturase [Thioalkalicoccus limnaeus]|uniref:Fatty acid desaturase n=1 Tax=Thioalkalicoccus limnaeus TaxID=120681 RepID=A0ABV4BKV7_9GAMM
MPLAIIDLPWWGVVLVILGLTHVTIASVTIFLHRHQAHHALDLHPIASHFFRAWLWLTTGTITREWVAIHRKHHAKCETPEDPHSPQVHGIGKVLFDGVDLYRQEASVTATLDQYGRGTPDDWLERHLYARHSRLGIGLMLTIDLILFGPIGLTIWAVQMLWIPLFAAGVINGIGHYWGYRRFAPNDTSRNILPWGILVGGEELHNNHHAYATSAKLSTQWWEFDLGWLYIRLLETLGLARVRRVAPKIHFDPTKQRCDTETLQAVITHRYAVLARFAKSLKRTARNEIRQRRIAAMLGLRESKALRAIQHGLQRGAENLPAPERLVLERVLDASPVLRKLYAMRRDLTDLWRRSAISKDQLVEQLEEWRRHAEASGIEALHGFSQKLPGYGLPSGAVHSSGNPPRSSAGFR